MIGKWRALALFIRATKRRNRCADILSFSLDRVAVVTSHHSARRKQQGNSAAILGSQDLRGQLARSAGKAPACNQDWTTGRDFKPTHDFPLASLPAL